MSPHMQSLPSTTGEEVLIHVASGRLDAGRAVGGREVGGECWEVGVNGINTDDRAGRVTLGVSWVTALNWLTAVNSQQLLPEVLLLSP